MLAYVTSRSPRDHQQETYSRQTVGRQLVKLSSNSRPTVCQLSAHCWLTVSGGELFIADTVCVAVQLHVTGDTILPHCSFLRPQSYKTLRWEYGGSLCQLTEIKNTCNYCSSLFILKVDFSSHSTQNFFEF